MLKKKFPKIRYEDLLFDGGKTMKSAWVLPLEAETKESGTLADYLEHLGVKVTEISLDGDEDDDEEDEVEEESFVHREAEEADEDEEE